MSFLKFGLRLFLTITYTWLTNSIFAQFAYQSKVFTVKDGLSSELSRNMLKDKDGFLWISTDKGLNRFDGNTFYTFKHRPDDPFSIANNSCNGLLEDRKGRLWINTDDGLSLFDRKKQSFVNYYPDSSVMPLAAIGYTDMAEDHTGNIWIGGYDDVLIFNPVSQSFEKSGWYDFARRSGIIKSEKRNNISQSIVKKSSSDLWIMTVYGLFSVHTPTKTFRYHPNPLVEDYFAFVIRYIDSKGVLWIGTYDQCFFSFDPDSGQWAHHTCPPREKELPDMMLAINKYDENTLLMTRTDGLFLYNTQTKQWTRFPLSDKIPSLSKYNFTNTMTSGKDLFILTAGNQAFIQLSEKKQYISKTKIPLPQNFINNHSYVTPNGNILTGDWKKNLIMVCDTLQCRQLTDLNKNNQLGQLQLYYTSGSGDHYISSSQKVYKWNTTDNTVVLLADAKDNVRAEFRNFVEDNKGNIYIRERSTGIYILRKGSSVFEYYDCGIQTDNFSALYFDRLTNKLWLATEKKGLYIIDPDSRQFKNYSLYHLAHNYKGYVNDISGDRDGNVFLLITGRGLVMMNSRYMAPRLYTSQDGLRSDAVKHGCISQNKYWFTSESGLMAFDYKQNRFYTFEQEDESKLFTYRIFPDNKEHITQNLFPDHFISVDKNILTDLQRPPAIYLKEVKQSGKIIPHDSIFTTSYDQNNFVFLFGNLGPTDLNHNDYVYRINGQTWQTLENGMINLYNLAPGNYLIELSYEYDLKYRYSLHVVVVPPWWKTSWFFIVASLFLLTLTYGLYRKRISTIRAEEAEKSKLKQRISEIEMTALRAQMNPHFIFNCLNSINRFILVNDTEAASAYLTKFSRFIRILLDGSREDLTSLDQETNALKLYIDMESMRFQDSFDWDINIDPDIKLHEVLVPSLVLQPYVENAIWHGLMQAPPGNPKKLSIHIYLSGQYLIIEITDNGIGRSRSAKIRSKAGNSHKSHGITLTQERLKSLEKVKGIKTDVRIDDLTDQEGNPTGTKVSLFFTLNISNP